MTKTFREAFIEALDRTGWSIRKVAGISGVSEEQLKKVNQGKSRSTNVDDAVKVANAFGVTLEEFLDDQTIQDRIEIVEQYLQLSPQERDFLQAAARGRRAERREGGE